MAITIEQLKQIIIEGETDWIHEVHEDEGTDSTPYIQGMIDEVSGCDSIEDLVEWYGQHGYRKDESYECIIGNLMQHCSLTKK